MPPEQLVDVPVPLVHGRSSYDQETRLLLESLHRSREEALEAARLVPVAEEQMFEEEEERRRRRPWWRSRGSFLTSVLVAGAGSFSPATSALVVGTAPLHTMSRSFIRTHGSAWCWWLVVSGFRGLASLGPFLGAPAGSPVQVKYTGGTGSGAWHLLTPSWVPSVLCCTTVMEVVEVVQLVLLLRDRSWYASATDHAGRGGGLLRRAALVQFLDKVADLPVASMTGCRVVPGSFQ